MDKSGDRTYAQTGGRPAAAAGNTPRRVKAAWHADNVRALRRHLGLSQKAMAEELGARQQTVSEWETGLYRPRGPSARLLTIIAEGAGFEYRTGGQQEETGKGQGDTAKRKAS